jgi:hypothetical protein
MGNTIDTTTKDVILDELKGTFDDGLRFANYLEAFVDGKITKDEFAEGCQEFVESVDDAMRRCRSQLVNILEHLFKIAFGTDSSLYEGWENDIIDKHRPPIEKELAWGTDKPWTNAINRVERQLDIANALAIRQYTIKAKNSRFPDLKDGVRRLPGDGCPFLLEQLIDDDVQSLVDHLRKTNP